METIHLITFASYLHESTAVQSAHRSLLEALAQHFTVKMVEPEVAAALGEDDFKLVFIATGGVEQAVVDHYAILPQPALLLADGLQNSLAASLEIAAWLHGKGLKCEILHGDIGAMLERVQVLYHDFSVRRTLGRSRIGVVGTPSSWLVASGVDYEAARQRWGVRFVDIALERLYGYYEQVTEAMTEELYGRFTSNARACCEAGPEDIRKALRVYLALRRLCEEERLDAVSLSCFQLLGEKATTGCLALALLNDEGIISGCEGDLQTVFSLLLAKVLTGVTGFMANPSMINARTGEMVWAHCTIGLKQSKEYIIRSHFESGIGVAIQGILPEGRITLLRCGGKGLDQYYLSTGALLENTDNVNMCRTQVRVRLDAPADYFMKRPLGNHHVLLQGDYGDRLQAFFERNL